MAPSVQVSRIRSTVAAGAPSVQVSRIRSVAGGGGSGPSVQVSRIRSTIGGAVTPVTGVEPFSTVNLGAGTWTQTSGPTVTVPTFKAPALPDGATLAFTDGTNSKTVTVLPHTILFRSPGPAAPRPYFPKADWLWGTVPTSPLLDPNSTVWAGYLASGQHVADMAAFGVTLRQATTPRFAVTFTGPWGDPFTPATMPIPPGTTAPTGSDAGVAVADPSTDTVWSLWQAVKTTGPSEAWSATYGGKAALSGDGIEYAGSSTAGNVSRYAGVIRAADLTAAVTANGPLPYAMFCSSDICAPTFRYPAQKSDGDNAGGVATPIPQGTRIHLDPTIDVDAIPGITAAEKVIAKTLQTRGAYILDKAGTRLAFHFEYVGGASPGAPYVAAGLAFDYFDMTHIPWAGVRVLAAGTTTATPAAGALTGLDTNVAGTATTAPPGSGVPMPVGDIPASGTDPLWRQVSAVDFNVDFPMGTLVTNDNQNSKIVSTDAASLYYQPLIRLYQDGHRDTSTVGAYSPSRFSCSGSILTLNLDYVAGVPTGGHIHPVIAGQNSNTGAWRLPTPGGRFKVRARFNATGPHWGGVTFFISNANFETDWSEGASSSSNIQGFHHNATSGQQAIATVAGQDRHQWHTYEVIYVANDRVDYLLDGVLIRSFTGATAVGSDLVSMHFQAATDGTLPTAGTTGTIDIDWMCVYQAV